MLNPLRYHTLAWHVLRLKNGTAQFGLAQIWVCSNLVRSNLAAQIWAAQKQLDTRYRDPASLTRPLILPALEI